MNYRGSRIMLRLLGCTLGIVGLCLVGYFFSWILAGGIFLMLWGNNLSTARFD